MHIGVSSSSSRLLGATATALIGLLLSAGIVAVPAPASAAPALSAAAVDAEPDSEPAVMGSYSESAFRAAAKALPEDLLTALDRDVSASGAEYLANAAAAADATAVLADLSEDGVEVAGSHLDGTTLVVNVESPADAEAVAATGAVPDFAAPVVPDLGDREPRFLTSNTIDPTVSGGEAFAEVRYGFRCSIGFSGADTVTAAKQLVTAGHCAEKKTTDYYFLPQTAASSGTRAFGTPKRRLGTPVARSFQFGDGNDAGLIALSKGFYVASPTVSLWDGAVGKPDTTLDVLDSTPAVARALICKSGATSGWSCGHVLAVDSRTKVEGEYVNSIITDVCTLSGDSGGAVVIGNSAVGVVSWGTASNACRSDDIAGFFPLVSAKKTSTRNQSVAKKSPRWEPMVKVAASTLAAPADGATLDYAAVINGSIPGAKIRHRIVVYVDGKATALGAKVTSAGTWNTRLVGVRPGTHELAVRVRWGKLSASALSAPITVTVKPLPAIAALSTPDPVQTSVDNSAAAYPAGTTAAYISTSASTTTIYAASAAAARGRGPVLLTAGTTVSAEVLAELRRLGVTKITIAGGPGAVTASSLAALRRIGAVAERTNAQLSVYART